MGRFDEEYRQGYCFDDADAVQRLLVAGAEFKWMDHLIAEHPQSGDAKHWRPREDWDTNFNLFHKKWPNPRAINGGVLSHARLNNWPEGR
jgi:hypothetical protein